MTNTPTEFKRLPPLDVLCALDRAGIHLAERERTAFVAAMHEVIRENQRRYAAISEQLRTGRAA